MSNDFEYQSNCLINVNIKSELNEEEDTEDMSEDIDREGDELMSGEELNPENNNQSIAELNSSQTESNVEVLAESGNALKSKNVSKKKVLTKRVCVGSGQKDCIIVGCYTKCRDQRELERHLEQVHRLMYIKEPAKASKARRAAPAPCCHLPSPLDVNVEPVMDKSKSSIGSGCLLEKQTKEVILNLKQYFSALFPKETKQTITDTIALATKIGLCSIHKIFKEFKDTGNLKAVVKTKNKKPFKFKYNDEDRDVLSRVVYKLRDENRLKGYISVYNEMKTSKEFNPTFKKCSLNTFNGLFKRFGFKISDNKIIDIKPPDSERERMACKRSKESKNAKYVCDWPGCLKEFKKTQHLITHLRTHTNVKPYVCRFAKCDYRCAVSGNFYKHLKCHNKTVFPDDDNEEFI